MAGEVLAAGLEFASALSLAVKRYSVDLDYTADAYTAVCEQLIRKVNPTVVVFAHTYQTRDYVPKLATRFGKTLISDVIAARFDGGSPVFVRQLFQGKFNADVLAVGSGPHFVSVQAGAWRAAPSQDSVETEEFTPSIDPSAVRQKPEAPFRESARAVDLTQAAIIVSVGRGIQEQGNIPVIEKLAEALGAELAASRPI
jgi:electron transfer flavoprotein alpha subunit